MKLSIHTRTKNILLTLTVFFKHKFAFLRLIFILSPSSIFTSLSWRKAKRLEPWIRYSISTQSMWIQTFVFRHSELELKAFSFKCFLPRYRSISQQKWRQVNLLSLRTADTITTKWRKSNLRGAIATNFVSLRIIVGCFSWTLWNARSVPHVLHFLVFLSTTKPLFVQIKSETQTLKITHWSWNTAPGTKDSARLSP